MKNLTKLAIVVATFLAIGIFFILISQDLDYYDNKLEVKSGGMSHGEAQTGIIDSGDIVLYSNVTDEYNVTTWAEGKTTDYQMWGDYGDVIIYYPYGENNNSEIIHRAMCWIDYNETSNKYNVANLGLENVSNVTIQEFGLNNYMPNHSGYITQGDNELTNPVCDQAGNICEEPIRTDWIIGKVYKLQED